VTTTADNIYAESADWQLLTEQTRTNCETTDSLMISRVQSMGRSDSCLVWLDDGQSHGEQDVIPTIIVITSI